MQTITIRFYDRNGEIILSGMKFPRDEGGKGGGGGWCRAWFTGIKIKISQFTGIKIDFS